MLSSFQATKCNTTRVKQTPHKNDSDTHTQTLIRQSSKSQRCTQNHLASHHMDRHNPMSKHTFTAHKDRTIRGSSEMKLRCISCLNQSVPAHQAAWQLWRWHHASFAQYKHNHFAGRVDRTHLCVPSFKLITPISDTKSDSRECKRDANKADS